MRISSLENLNTEIICADLRDIYVKNEFDVVLNMAEEKLRIEELSPHSSLRLYSLNEIKDIFKSRQMVVKNTFGKFDESIPSSHRKMQLLVYSQKT